MHDNKRALLLASFFTLIAAGVGFGVRAGVLADWSAAFGLTQTQLGQITGGGLTGFGIVIILSSLFVDKLGYKPLLVLAFVLHVLSAIVTVLATPIFNAVGKDPTYWCLFIGMFMFAVANGLCEAVINPLVATLYSDKKTHYLNILHAGWPAGMIFGGILTYTFVGKAAKISHLRWEIPMLLFLIPVLIYGVMALKEKFPHSEAKAAGVTFVEMLREFAAPVLLMLLVLHAMVGYVELGTDSWITNIMNNVFPGTGQGVLVFLYTASIMFVLRFFAGPIVEKINPLGLLFVSAILGCLGLLALGAADLTVASVLVAATIYGLGKTFFWPTMLGVVGEQFPRGGALTLGAIGGIGMLSAGLLGGPGIGYTQDYYAAAKLQEDNPQVYEQVAADNPNRFLFFPPITGLDGAKVARIQPDNADYEVVHNATIYGGQTALKVTALIPAIMALGYLILLIYFRMQGGYKAVVLSGGKAEGE